MTIVIDGKEIAQNLKNNIKKQLDEIKLKIGKVPGLAVVQVGNVPASSIYVKAKTKSAKEVGIEVIDRHLSEQTSQEVLLKIIQSLNNQELLPGLKVLFIDSQIEDEFEFFLQELRIVIRLIENFDIHNPSAILKSHLVKKGDTLYRLSVIYGVPISDIQSANNLGTSTHITFGSLIIIPE